MHYVLMVRTTLSIDDDVLFAAKALADQQRRSVGAVLSELARRSLREPAKMKKVSGIPQLPVSNPEAVVTLEIVNQLRDAEP
jgi:hypothetical protein